MDISEAIRTRRSVSRLDPEAPVGRELVAELLELARWAPNHKHTEPWRFTVLAGEARRELGLALQEGLRELEAPEAKVAAAPEKPLRAPVVIAVTARGGPSPLVTRENRHAVAAAVQNLLLAAHARGLGAIWRTGAAAYSAPVARWLGLGEGDAVLGFVYLGRPLEVPPGRRALGVVDCTTWRGWH